MAELLLRGLALALLLMGAETLHGMARLRWLVTRLGGRRDKRVSIVSGSLLAFLLVALALPTLPLPSSTGLLLLGIALAASMAAYDAALGRWVFHRSWRAVVQDFNPFRGNLLVLGGLFWSSPRCWPVRCARPSLELDPQAQSGRILRSFPRAAPSARTPRR